MPTERVRCDIPEGYVFALTPDMRADDGWVCAAWSKTARLLFKGRMRVVSVGDKAFVVLVNEDGAIFANLPVASAASVEKVVDSSRYFVVRAVSEDRVAHFGMGFSGRDDAHRFSSAVFGHFQELESIAAAANIEAREFSLPSEPIDLHLNIARPARRQHATTSVAGGQAQTSFDIPDDWVTF